MDVGEALRGGVTEHRWSGNPHDAERWREEKRRRAPVYIAVGGGTVAISTAVALAGWDSLEPWNRVMLVALGALFGGTVLAFGPLLYWMAERHSIWLELPMREGWTGDATSLGDALKGYLSSQGVRWQRGRFMGPPAQGLLLLASDGLQVMLQISDIPHGPNDRKVVTLSIHCINPDNVGAAEALQSALDGWPLLAGLEEGVDAALLEETLAGPS